LHLSLLALGLATFLVAGCASGPGTLGDASYDRDKPQTFIPNAKVEHVRGVAMGMAKSKGWSFVDSTDGTLVMQRPLNAAAAETIEPGAGLDPEPALVQVRSSFFPRQSGVDVVLDAQVMVHRGTGEEKRIDYTEEYRPDLMRSLTALRTAWNESRGRVASALPPIPSPWAQQSTASTPAPEDAAAETGTARATVAGEPTGPPVAPPRDAWGGPPALESRMPPPVMTRTSAPPPTAAAAAAPAPAPVPEIGTARPPAPVPETGSARPPAPAPATTLALREPRGTGVWAYYAEQYARLRGCAVTGEGAVLTEKTNVYEKHRVACENGTEFLVKCNAGACRGLR
jgi:hypothetical protein